MQREIKSFRVKKFFHAKKIFKKRDFFEPSAQIIDAKRLFTSRKWAL